MRNTRRGGRPLRRERGAGLEGPRLPRESACSCTHCCDYGYCYGYGYGCGYGYGYGYGFCYSHCTEPSSLCSFPIPPPPLPLAPSSSSSSSSSLPQPNTLLFFSLFFLVLQPTPNYIIN